MPGGCKQGPPRARRAGVAPSALRFKLSGLSESGESRACPRAWGRGLPGRRSALAALHCLATSLGAQQPGSLRPGAKAQSRRSTRGHATALTATDDTAAGHKLAAAFSHGSLGSHRRRGRRPDSPRPGPGPPGLCGPRAGCGEQSAVKASRPGATSRAALSRAAGCGPRTPPCLN